MRDVLSVFHTCAVIARVQVNTRERNGNIGRTRTEMRKGWRRRCRAITTCLPFSRNQDVEASVATSPLPCALNRCFHRCLPSVPGGALAFKQVATVSVISSQFDHNSADVAADISASGSGIGMFRMMNTVLFAAVISTEGAVCVECGQCVFVVPTTGQLVASRVRPCMSPFQNVFLEHLASDYVHVGCRRSLCSRNRTTRRRAHPAATVS